MSHFPLFHFYVLYKDKYFSVIEYLIITQNYVSIKCICIYMYTHVHKSMSVCLKYFIKVFKREGTS